MLKKRILGAFFVFATISAISFIVPHIVRSLVMGGKLSSDVATPFVAIGFLVFLLTGVIAIILLIIAILKK